MSQVEGVSVIGRQLLGNNLFISDGRMSVLLYETVSLNPRLYGRISVEGGKAFGLTYQVFYATLWLPGRYFQLPQTLLPDTYDVAVYWSVPGLAWRLFWV